MAGTIRPRRDVAAWPAAGVFADSSASMIRALKVLNLSQCPKCGQAILPHQTCKNCGVYNGREVIDVLKKLTKREQKKRKKELQEQEEQAKTEKPLSAQELSKK